MHPASPDLPPRPASRAKKPARKPKPSPVATTWLPHPDAGKRKLILRCWYSLGDITLLTAAVRDLHRSHPGKFLTDLRTPFDDLWLHNPHITPIEDGEGEVIECDYALLNESNTGPWHCIHSFTQNLASQLGISIHPSRFRGDIQLHPLERAWTPQVAERVGADVPYWIIAAGGKTDITIKWWATERWQAIVDHFKGRILFAQIGSARDHHPALSGVLDLRGQTDVRQLVRLVHHSAGVLCPVTGVMHLAAAVPTRADRPPNRPCVVIAGGREPTQWQAYPHHQFLHTLGALPCCDNGGCWKARTVPIGDGDAGRDASLCVDVVHPSRKRGKKATSPLSASALPHCMAMITPSDVIRAIEHYYEGGTCSYQNASQYKQISDKLLTNKKAK